ncbi:MAG: rRNA maturation RNase YbeY [Acidobacteria bacterium]|jgi:probable rRNA maturation factor|nr:rRNA maturation RNase YbeY [Acidobacteriota bacterium]
MITIDDEEFKVEQAFYLEKLEKVILELNLQGNIVIKLGSKEESQDLNTRYLQKDYPTDVLSFPFNEEVPEEGFYIGDIFICYPIAEEQAKENGLSVEEELLTLMVHGILHLAGYDHETDSGEMEKLQNQLIEKIAVK